MRSRSFLLAVTASVLLGATSIANAAGYKRNYEVTITNVTAGQVFSPVLVVAHSRNISLFELGEPASDGLAAIAEGGDTGPLLDALAGSSDVIDTATTGPVPPGKSATVMISTSRRGLISVASMMVNTNDALMAVRNIHPPRYSLSRRALGYDAGSELNDEACDNIPGPACGGKGGSPGIDGEGFVHIHPGVHGIAGLDPSIHDWRNPVAIVRVKRVR